MGNNQNAGIINFGIKQYINEEFNKVRKNPKRDYLTISEILEVIPHQDYPFDFRHLAILVVCDKNLDGKFSMQDLEHFALWIQLNLVSVQMYEFKSQLQGRTTQKLIQILQKKDKISNPKNKKTKQKQKLSGEDMLVQWVIFFDIFVQFLKLLIQDDITKTIKNIPYLKVECIKLIYQIFNIKIMTQMDIQQFFYLIKRSSQDLGYPIVQYEQNQEEEQFIAIPVCEQFIKHFIKGVLKILNDIGYLNQFL